MSAGYFYQKQQEHAEENPETYEAAQEVGDQKRKDLKEAASAVSAEPGAFAKGAAEGAAAEVNPLSAGASAEQKKKHEAALAGKLGSKAKAHAHGVETGKASVQAAEYASMAAGAGVGVKAAKKAAKKGYFRSAWDKLKSLFTGNKKAKPKTGQSGGPNANKPFSKSTQDAAEKEAGGKCVFCQKKTIRTKKPHPDRRNTDHAIPKADGGTNQLPNAQNTCQACNLQKGRKTTEEFLKTKQK